MNFIINGKPHTHTGNGSLIALLSELQAAPEQVAVMINNEVIKNSEKSTISLQEGDEIEIITYAAGG